MADDKFYRSDMDIYASKYGDSNPARSIDQFFLDLLAKKTVANLKGPSILEMGYGDGVWTSNIINRFGCSYIIDASSELLQRAKNRFSDRATCFHAFFEEWRPPMLFDSVLCTHVLEHVVDPIQILMQCRKWIKPDGLLFVAVPNSQSLHRRLGVLLGLQNKASDLKEMDVEMGHQRVYDSKMLERDIFNSGFSISQRVSVMCKPLPNSSLTHLNEKQLRGLFDLGDQLPEEFRGVLAWFCEPV